MISEGSRFGDYRIERMIGWGGGGVVYEATQLSVGRRVALKLLRSELGEDPEFVARFKREGRVQASLEHAHVLDVYEAGESEHGLFLALRLLEGGSLATEIASGALSAERALTLLAQVAEALDAAHEAGIVHGDVKPQNVLLEDAETAYLTDFGLTRELGRTRATASVAVMGTVAYLSPEVIHGERATPASDRYSLAAMAFECLSGARPYSRPTAAAMMFAHTSDPVPAASGVRPELPKQLDAVLAAGLAKDPATRPGSATKLVAACREAIGDEQIGKLGPPELAEAPRGTGKTPTPAPAPQAARARRSLVPIIAAALVAAAVAVAITVALDDGPEPVATTEPTAPAGSLVLGSDLAADADRSVDCSGQEATLGSRPCSLLQAALPGSTLRVPADGVITSWSIRGATGDVALQVFRDEGDKSYQVARSQYVTVPDGRVHTYDTDMSVTKGDRISLEMGPGASVGIADTSGATTARWYPVLRGNPSAARPTKGPGSGLDGEVLVQAHIEEGVKPDAPKQIQGKQAARLPNGEELRSFQMTFASGLEPEVALVELNRELYFDLFIDGERAARIAIPDIAPGGQVLDYYTYVYDDSANFGEVGITYANPSSGRIIERIYGVYDTGFELYV